METPVERNRAQQEVVDLLGANRVDRPVFDTALRDDLRETIEQGLEPLLDRARKIDHRLWISKHTLAQVLGCETKYLAEAEEEFGWNVANARGTISHKAIELSIHWRREPEPPTLVDEAMGRLIESDQTIAVWLQKIGEAEQAELRAECVDRVVKFMECFPPLKTRWRPVTESRLRYEVHDQFVFSGKVDLTLGHAEGNRAGKVIIDLKTGGFSPQHPEDLRFYALIETLRLGTPPRLTTSYYLDRADFIPEDVTEEVLFAAASRLIDGTAKIVELLGSEREPNLLASTRCHWCPVRDDCETGIRFLEQDDESSGW